MNRKEHITALASLGNFVDAWLLDDELRCSKLAGNGSYTDFSHAAQLALKDNEWFTEEGVRESLAVISSEMLNEGKLMAWLQKYSYKDSAEFVKPVGVIAAGNIPLVCFHDIISVLLSGYGIYLKPSSKDRVLIEKAIELLVYFEPKLRSRVKLTAAINQMDISGLIATGSSNTARYVEYGYSAVPVLSRKNRTSIAVLTGGETEEELQLLSDDIFSYFGMGCRNVSKLYIPDGYDFALFSKAAKKWAERLKQQPKYIGSYRHELAVSLSLSERFIDGEFFMLKESKSFNSPLSVIYYEFFSNLGSVKNQIIQNAELLQCVVSADGIIGNVRFGQAQKPGLSDYADGVDTVQWLIRNIN